MINLNDLKKEKNNALKEHDKNKLSILSVVITNLQNVEIEKRSKGQTLDDNDVLSSLKKSLKALHDEKEMYLGANKKEEVENIDKQIKYIESFLPAMISEKEIREIISKLEDKSIKNIMTVFKTKYAGQVDFALVSKIAKEN